MHHSVAVQHKHLRKRAWCEQGLESLPGSRCSVTARMLQGPRVFFSPKRQIGSVSLPCLAIGDSLIALATRWFAPLLQHGFLKPPSSSGYGSKLSQQGTAGFGPCSCLPGFHCGYIFSTHSQIDTPLCICPSQKTPRRAVASLAPRRRTWRRACNHASRPPHRGRPGEGRRVSGRGHQVGSLMVGGPMLNGTILERCSTPVLLRFMADSH